MKARIPTAIALAGLLACGHAAAQFKNTDDATDYRQGVFTVMAHHFGRIGQMVNGKAPFDARAVQANADLVATLAKLPWAGFVPGSDQGQTSAKPEVWSQPGKFKADAQKLQDTSARLAEVAKAGDPDAIKTAFGAVADSCKGCHDDFRKRR